MFRHGGVELSHGATSTVAYRVEGLTCEKCIVKVLDRVRELPGVDGVAVDLVRGGESVVTVRSDPGASLEEVVAAVGEAGFVLTGHWPGVHEAQQEGMTRPGPESAAFDLSKGGRR